MRLSVLLLLTACAKQAAPVAAVPGAIEAEGEVVAMVGDQPITQPMIEAMLADMPAEQIEAVKASGQWPDLVHQLQVAEALYQRAVAAGVQDQPEVQLELAMSARSLLAKAYVEQYVEDAVSEADLQAFYDENADRYAVDQVRASHILVSTTEDLAPVLEALEAGEDFAAVAKKFSKDPGSGANGGDLGWFGRGQMVEPFEEAAFTGEEGVVSEPFATQYGEHLVLVTGKRDKVPLDEVSEEIRGELESKAVEVLLGEVEAELGTTP